MSAPVNATRMHRMWDAHCDAIMLALKGTPLVNRDGELVLLNGEPVILPPTAAHLREARELMKQCGIDEEPLEGSKIVEVAKSIRHYDDDDTLILENQ